MAKKNASDPNALAAFPPAPVFYADQPSAMMLGPHISRISFGVEEMDDGDLPRPVVTIALPTVALLQFVNDAKRLLDAAGFKKDVVQALEQSAKTIASGGDVTPPQKMTAKRIVGKSAPRRLK